MKTQNVKIFWEKFNEVFKIANGTAAQFNPRGWCTDMAASDFSGISVVYGADVLKKMNGCKFHYNQSIQRQLEQLDVPHYGTFHTFAQELLSVRTPEAYAKVYGDFELYVSSNNETHNQVSWLRWWNDRRQFMFKAFSSIDGPSSNLAEVVHALWKNSKEINLSILNCAYSDVKASLLLKQHLTDLVSGDYDGGRGPSHYERGETLLAKEVQTVSQIGRDLLDFGIDMTITPTMVNFFDDEDGNCEPKKKRAPSRNKLFSNRLEGARCAKYTMKIGNVTSITNEHRIFGVASSDKARTYYQVRVHSPRVAAQIMQVR